MVPGERETAAEASRASEERLKLALDAARAGIWDWDIRTGEVRWSENLEAIHGLARGAFGGTFADLLDAVHPEDREVVERSIAHAIEQGSGLHVEYRVTRSDGGIHWLEGRGRPVRDETGRPVRMLGVCIDITERKRAEAALRESGIRKDAILAAALDSIITIDHEGRVIDFNPAAERTFGYRCSEAMGRPLAELIIPPSQREAHRRGLARYLATGEGPWLGKRIETTALRADGTELPVELAITAVALGGSPTFTAYLRDIAGRKRAEEEHARLLAREHAACGEAEAARARKRLAFLAEASVLLASSLDYEATLKRVARLAVPAFAGWCIVDIIEGRSIIRVAVAGADPEKERLLNQ